jgi:hypothetical protein
MREGSLRKKEGIRIYKWEGHPEANPWFPRFPVPVTTVRMFLLCPRNSHSSPFFKMPRSSVPVTTVPRPGTK